MGETVEVKKDIEVTCICTECGCNLEISLSADVFGDIRVEVDICECAKTEEQ